LPGIPSSYTTRTELEFSCSKKNKKKEQAPKQNIMMALSTLVILKLNQPTEVLNSWWLWRLDKVLLVFSKEDDIL